MNPDVLTVLFGFAVFPVSAAAAVISRRFQQRRQTRRNKP